MTSNKLTLNIADYLIMGSVLLISVLIGVFFRSINKKTNEDYLFAGKNMSLIPVLVSFVASFINSTAMLGVSAEMYTFGTNWAFGNISQILGAIIGAYFFLSIYFTNDISTVYEYLDKRFGKKIRIFMSATFIIHVGMSTSIAIYGPALALNAVTDIPMWMSIVIIGCVSTLYSTMGGIKAVIWTDIFQGILMCLCVLAIIIKGSIDMGGIANILHTANEGGRIVIPKFSMDMTAQYTMINVVLQSLIIITGTYVANQVYVQRLRTLKTLEKARRASILSIPLIVIFQLMCCLCGLVFYAYFQHCDPLTAPDKPIHSPDQLMPYYIMSVMQEYPGLSGLCIAGIFSAALSSISSTLNSLTAVTIGDFVHPFWPYVSESIVVSKLICFVYGTLVMALSFALVHMNNLVEMSIKFTGIVSGPKLGVFILAAFTRSANEEGTLLGFVSGLIVTAVLSFLPNSVNLPFLPVSNECTELHETNFYTSNTTLNAVYNSSYDISNTRPEVYNNKSFSIPISYMWFTFIGFVLCLIVGYFSSIIINFFQNENREVPDIYLSPVRTWFSKKKI